MTTPNRPGGGMAMDGMRPSQALQKGFTPSAPPIAGRGNTPSVPPPSNGGQLSATPTNMQGGTPPSRPPTTTPTSPTPRQR